LILYDGNYVHHCLNKDLGSPEVDRVENIRRIAEVARLMVDAAEFGDVFVTAPLDVAKQDSRKGLFSRAWQAHKRQRH